MTPAELTPAQRIERLTESVGEVTQFRAAVVPIGSGPEAFLWAQFVADRWPGIVSDISAVLAELDRLKAEQERLRNALSQSYAEDWTASLCDRLNEFAREHSFAECDDGSTASLLIQSLHGYAGEMRRQLSEMKRHLRDIDEDLKAWTRDPATPEYWLAGIKDKTDAALAPDEGTAPAGADNSRKIPFLPLQYFDRAVESYMSGE